MTRTTGKPTLAAKTDITLEVPGKWTVKKASDFKFRILCRKPAPKSRLKVKVRMGKNTYSSSFVIFGTDRMKGSSAILYIDKCRACGARKKYCVCKKR